MQYEATDRPPQSRVTILRLPSVIAQAGMGRSAIYESISKRLFPRPVRLVGTRAVGWPSNEVEAVVAATVAGISEDDMRSLVARLDAGRKSAH